MVENQPLNENSPAVQSHLTMMQGVINRMAENSRSCKVWCVTLVAATLVLVARTGEPQHALIALVPTLLFLFLDSYYLALERAFIRSQNAFVVKLHEDNLKLADLYRVIPTGMGLASCGSVSCGSVSAGFGVDLAILPVSHSNNTPNLVIDYPVGYTARRRKTLTTNQVPKHKVFISYYHAGDQEYKNRLVQALDSKFVDKSVSQGDIHDESLPLDEIRRRIRNGHVADATVTIVLISPFTWQRKHVDWEISASIINRRNNQRCGLLGLLLPTHPDYHKRPENRNPRLLPPRLARNIGGNDPFAVIYDWPKNGLSKKVLPKIHTSFLRRNKTPWPDDGLRLFRDNRTGDCRRGWQG